MLNLEIAALIFINGLFTMTVSKTYFASTIRAGWEQQRQHCEQNGGVLASFDTYQDVVDIYNLCKSLRWSDGCYVGFHDRDGDGTYRFTGSNAPVNIGLLANGYPTTSRTSVCGAVIHIWALPNVMGNFWCGAGVYGICEVPDGECKICNDDYIYINDGVPRTYAEAKAICELEHGGLATVTESSFDCIVNAFNSGECATDAAWIGLRFPYLFPDEKYWKNGEPEDCDNGGGSRCVGIDGNGMDNSVKCENTRLGALCNKISGSMAIADINNMDHDGDNNNNNFGLLDDPYNNNNNKYVPTSTTIITYASVICIILFVLVNNVLLCYWCIFKRNKQEKTKQIDMDF